MLKKLVSSLLLLILILTMGVFVSQAGAGQIQMATVTARYLNVREGPSTNTRVMGVIHASETYPVIGQVGTWWQIQLNDWSGYVSSRYVTVSGTSPTNPTPVANPTNASTCTMTLFFSTTPQDICVGDVHKTQAAYQSYQNGFMIWLKDGGDIWVFVNGGSRSPWTHYQQSDYAGYPDSTGTPPAGLILPINGFGKMWMAAPGLTQAKLKDDLGWATASEVFYNATWQIATRATVYNAYLTLPDGRIVNGYNGMAGIFWSFGQ